MIFYLKSVLLLFSSFSFFASNTDDIKPKIEFVNPVEATEVVRGKAIKISAVLSDNIALEDYEVKITKGGTKSLRYVECFSCNHLTNSQLDKYGKNIPVIKGEKNVHLNFNIGVEEDAVPGDYYLFLLVKDKAGNEVVKKINFMIVRF
jgi:hypothetical protein